jgi:hypothetical protein
MSRPSTHDAAHLAQGGRRSAPAAARPGRSRTAGTADTALTARVTAVPADLRLDVLVVEQQAGARGSVTERTAPTAATATS